VRAGKEREKYGRKIQVKVKAVHTKGTTFSLSATVAVHFDYEYPCCL
jgi:hypothetical protein